MNYFDLIMNGIMHYQGKPLDEISLLDLKDTKTATRTKK